jgi:plastocyanin
VKGQYSLFFIWEDVKVENNLKEASSRFLPFAFCLLPSNFFLAPIISVFLIAVLLIPERMALAGRVVRGRFELVNSKTKNRTSQPDAGGVVVWMVPAIGAPPQSANRPRRMITQRNKRFMPHIVVVQTGEQVDFPNEDPFFHNVFSIFNGRRFDLGLYASGETRPVNFNRPGISYIFCNIHPQMSAIVVAVDTPYFVISDQSGKFEISNVPEGQYRFNVWHERSKADHLAGLMRSVQVTSSGLDLGVIQVSEEGYIPRPHSNKFGREYDKLKDRPGYRRP